MPPLHDIHHKREIHVLYTAEQIEQRIDDIARKIAISMVGLDEVMIVSLLKGSFMFTADLARALYRSGMHPQLDFMTISSYGTGTQSSGNISIHRDLADDVSGKHILLVDDILESGRTLDFARSLLLQRGAASIRIAVLLEKPGKRDLEVEADFLGFSIPDKFVVGYGLDYANYYRELPYIGTIDVH